MRNVARKQQNLALADRQIDAAAILDGAQEHVALELVEELCARVVVIVLAGIRTADDHDDELGVLEHLLVPDRRLQQVSVLVDPALEIEGGQRLHAVQLVVPAAPAGGSIRECRAGAARSGGPKAPGGRR